MARFRKLLHTKQLLYFDKVMLITNRGVRLNW